MSKELAAKLLFICIILLGFVSLKYLKVKKEYGKESRAKMYFYNENVKLKSKLDSVYKSIECSLSVELDTCEIK
jgi:hypothetical protein